MSRKPKSKTSSPMMLLCGDALQLLKKLPDNSVDLVCTDPPYKVISGGNNTKHKAGWKVSVLKANDGKIFKHNAVKVSDWLPELYRVLKPGRDCYVMTNNKNLFDFMAEAKKAGFKFHNLLRWEKNTRNANRWYMIDCEWTLYLYKPPARTINNPGSRQGFKANNPRNKLHPTQKPVSLFKHYITNSTEPGWLVLDPFAGVGTAALACIATGRKFIGYELDKTYFKIATKRINRKLSK